MWGSGWLLALVEGGLAAANDYIKAHHDAAAAAAAAGGGGGVETLLYSSKLPNVQRINAMAG